MHLPETRRLFQQRGLTQRAALRQNCPRGRMGNVCLATFRKPDTRKERWPGSPTWIASMNLAKKSLEREREVVTRLAQNRKAQRTPTASKRLALLSHAATLEFDIPCQRTDFGARSAQGAALPRVSAPRKPPESLPIKITPSSTRAASINANSNCAWSPVGLK